MGAILLAGALGAVVLICSTALKAALSKYPAVRYLGMIALGGMGFWSLKMLIMMGGGTKHPSGQHGGLMREFEEMAHFAIDGVLLFLLVCGFVAFVCFLKTIIHPVENTAEEHQQHHDGK